MAAPVQIIGTPVSPYVRKVLVCLDLKEIAYQVDPIVAFLADEGLTDLNPVRRIPVFIDDQVILADSTVICEYLDDRYPGTQLYPADPANRAKARWLEEYADTMLADVLLWRLFNEAIINPSIWGRPRNLDAMKRTIEEDVPPIMDYLESVLPGEGFLFGGLGAADIALGVQFRNAAWARFSPDPSRWPIVAAYVDRVLDSTPFKTLQPFEDVLVRTPVPQQRGKLVEMGFPVADMTLLVDGPPRQGPMTVRTD
ncbi:MAG: glutathione S-transferase family protein [Proteobacteria bacterium]|nr:glutathione S-transferase family protein [Pseudomonadota bacterium]